MKKNNTKFFILMTANIVIAVLVFCAFIFSWTLLIPIILLTIVAGGLNCVILKSPKENALCFIPPIVSAIATLIADIAISVDYDANPIKYNSMPSDYSLCLSVAFIFLTCQAVILMFMALISTIMKFKATHTDFKLNKPTQVIIATALVVLNMSWGLWYLSDITENLFPAVYFAGLGIMVLNCIYFRMLPYILCSIMIFVSSYICLKFYYAIYSSCTEPNINTLQNLAIYFVAIILLTLYNYSMHKKSKIE